MRRKLRDTKYLILILAAGFYLIASFTEVFIHSLDKGYEYSKMNFFSVITADASMEMANHEENKVDVPVETKTINIDELYLLAHVINAEGGAANWVSDDMCYYIGSVVLNRVKSKDFPNTIEGVVYQKGQYACVHDGNWNVPINDRSLEIASDLLFEGSCLPDNVLFQAQFKQGKGIYIKEQNMYFCYK